MNPPLSYWGAVAATKCPRCRQGNMFTHPMYHPLKFASMNHHCPKCGLRFEVEPGFFYGAMYVAYAIGVAAMIGSFLAVLLLLKQPKLVHFLAVPITAILGLFPFTFRYSRVLMLYWFGGVKYEPSRGGA